MTYLFEYCPVEASIDRFIKNETRLAKEDARYRAYVEQRFDDPDRMDVNSLLEFAAYNKTVEASFEQVIAAIRAGEEHKKLWTSFRRVFIEEMANDKWEREAYNKKEHDDDHSH